jgi:hypothetical protein
MTSSPTTCDLCGEDDDEVGYLPVTVADGTATRSLRCCDLCRQSLVEAWSRRIRRLPDDRAPLLAKVPARPW